MARQTVIILKLWKKIECDVLKLITGKRIRERINVMREELFQEAFRKYGTPFMCLI